MRSKMRGQFWVAMITGMRRALDQKRQSGPTDLGALAVAIKAWGRDLGFQTVGISDIDLSAAEPRSADWIARGFAGDLDYMRKHGAKRTRPAALVPGTVSVISARMDYLP